MNTQRWGHGVTARASSVESYNVDTNKWTTDVAPLPSGRSFFGVATLNGMLYCVGGSSKDHRVVDLVENYDPVSGRWTTCPPLGAKRQAHGVLNGCIYALRGYNSEPGGLNTMERYDPRLDQ